MKTKQKHRKRRRLPILAKVCEAPNRLGHLDIAAVNLMCAVGLPHAQFNFQRMLDWLDEAARQADIETRRHWYRFLDSPQTYNGSAGYFCCYHLLQTLQEDFGVRYNPARVKDPKFQDPKCIDPDFTDSRDLFIHGIIDGPGGTCGSMPVVYIAVGRRLGYPLKLVEARGHLYFRWDDPTGQRLGVKDRFNVDGAGYGIASHPDEHYETWPEPWSEWEKAGGFYGKSMTPAQELATFLVTRAECLIDNDRVPEAIQAYRWAAALVPDDPRWGRKVRHLDGTAAAELYRLWQPYEEFRRRQLLREERAEMPAVMRGLAQPAPMRPFKLPGPPVPSCLSLPHFPRLGE
jgi:hypothetical protein